MAQLKDRTRKKGGVNSDNWFLNLLNRQRRLSDFDKGLLRHFAGGSHESVWDYAPSDPPVPLIRARTFIWNFASPADLVTDAVSATEYVWAETALGSGTPLAAVDVAGGGAKFINGARDDDYYFYESGAEIGILASAYDLWFSGVIQISDATQSELFFGLCARLASGNLFDNRVNCVGFKKDDGDTNIDLETSLASSATNVNAAGTITADTPSLLQFHYKSSVPEVIFFIDGDYAGRIEDTLPTTEMCVSFGLRNGEAVAKNMTVQTITLMLEVER